MPNSFLPSSVTGDPEFHGVDLHRHSTASDGALAPSEVVALCASRGVKLMALTDHDTVAGVSEAAAAASRQGIRLLPGAELSTRWQGISIHLVALLPQGPRGPLMEGLEILARARESRAVVIARQIGRASCRESVWVAVGG